MGPDQARYMAISSPIQSLSPRRRPENPLEKTSKELLELEQKDISSPTASILRICENESKVRDEVRKKKVEGRIVTAPTPRSEVLGRVKDFLGVLSEASKSLELNAKDNPEDYDIEVLNGDESKYIKMDLMLGIADLHTPEAVAAAEAAVAGHPTILDFPSHDSSAESGRSSDEEEDDDNDDDTDEEDSLEDDDENKDDIEQVGSPVRTQSAGSHDDDSLNVGLRSHKRRDQRVALLGRGLRSNHINHIPTKVNLISAYPCNMYCFPNNLIVVQSLPCHSNHRQNV
ncbi:hypothetical protein AKJ16_DCAP14982 [Drosera capensis]